MEVIDDWPAAEPDTQAASGASTSRRVAPSPALAHGAVQRLAAALAGFEPRVLTLHCYEDVGLRWIALSFDSTVIAPSVVLRAGDCLAPELTPAVLLFSSLRPRGVVYLLDESPARAAGASRPAADDRLPASRYGVALAQLRTSRTAGW
ncbi:MAG: hypothetical protein HUU30_05515 [Burkholderiaceae bacterium]|jgi:hypothetical protein|nr:hypothetical protein [Aquabacterium sp.]NUP85197.1 hypothetical protein [Burkholderiaceae bacterium]